MWTASAGYSFGRGQRLSAGEISNPGEIFESGFFQTAAFQLGAGFNTGTNVRTVLRFSPNATVFAIDPFAGRLAVYDPSLSIQITQDLASFGLPVRAEAVLTRAICSTSRQPAKTERYLHNWVQADVLFAAGSSLRF